MRKSQFDDRSTEEALGDGRDLNNYKPFRSKHLKEEARLYCKKMSDGRYRSPVFKQSHLPKKDLLPKGRKHSKTRSFG